MASAKNTTPPDFQRLQEDLQSECVFYEVYPDLTWHPGDHAVSWFEIALHAEADGYEPPDTSGNRHVYCLLTELAEVLSRQIQDQAPHEGYLSAGYWTLHPPHHGNNSQVKMTRSISLVVFNIAQYRKGEEPALLTDLKTQLNLLGIGTEGRALLRRKAN